jgi:beta-lactamase regulating signal transducer with metallopeptidase domain
MIAAMIKSAIVLVAAALVASLMKRQSAAVRHAVWTAGLIGAMAVPLFTLTLPSWQTSLATPVVTLFQKFMVPLAILQQAAIGIWIAGATVGILLLLYSAGRLAWVAIGAEPVEDARWAALAEEVRQNLGIRRPVRLLQNRSVPFLGTWGILSPRVLLPRDAESWPDDRVRMVLAHELSHIQRHDWVVQVLADAARAIYWFNPIFWLASSRLRRESEHACDDAVVRLGAVGHQYAEELLAMTRALRSEERLQSPILAMAQPSHLELRLLALLNPSLNRLAATPWAVIVVAGVAIALTLPLAAVRPGSETPSTEATLTPLPSAPPVASTLPEPEPQPVKAAPTVRKINPPVAPITVPGGEPATLTPPAAVTPPALISSSVSTPPPALAPPRAPVAEPNTNTTPGNTVVASSLLAPCNVTASEERLKTGSVEKKALGTGPWIINDDQTIWASDQPYVAKRPVTTVWMRPANTELEVVARRLDGDAPKVTVGPAQPYQTAYIATPVTFPTAGCWEVTATAGTSKLIFVTRVRD